MHIIAYTHSGHDIVSGCVYPSYKATKLSEWLWLISYSATIWEFAPFELLRISPGQIQYTYTQDKKNNNNETKKTEKQTYCFCFAKRSLWSAQQVVIYATKIYHKLPDLHVFSPVSSFSGVLIDLCLHDDLEGGVRLRLQYIKDGKWILQAKQTEKSCYGTKNHDAAKINGFLEGMAVVKTYAAAAAAPLLQDAPMMLLASLNLCREVDLHRVEANLIACVQKCLAYMEMLSWFCWPSCAFHITITGWSTWTHDSHTYKHTATLHSLKHICVFDSIKDHQSLPLQKCQNQLDG